MRILVTGAAGFIGSTLCERLVADGRDVVGVDCFTDYYARELKERNLTALRKSIRFSFVETGVQSLAKKPDALDGVEAVFHLAAQPGVRRSWGASFDVYIRDNVAATQALLELLKEKEIAKFVYASSSSVYGDAESFPTPESATPRPLSPYGVTKLAAEHLCRLYWKSFGVPAVSLRFFSVYGPRQRPDMAFCGLIDAIKTEKKFTVFGDGEQTRDFTFVDDIVDCCLLALEKGRPGEVYNAGGRSRVTLNQTIELAERLIGKRADLERLPAQRGDARDTAADISKATAELGYAPTVELEEGLKRQIEYSV